MYQSLHRCCCCAGSFTGLAASCPKYAARYVVPLPACTDECIANLLLGYPQAMVYSADKKQTKIEFPEARLWEENMNVLLHERGCESPVATAADEPTLHPRAMARSIPAQMALTDTI